MVISSPFLERVDVTGFVVAIVGTVAWGLALGWIAGASFGLGAAIGLLNFVLLRILMGRLVAAARDNQEPPTGLVILAVAKFGALALVIFLIVVVIGVDPVAFASGMSAILVAIAIEFVRYSYLRRRSPASGNDASPSD